MEYEKTIYLYGEVGDSIGRVQYIDHMGTDKSIVSAARVSFGKDNDKPLDERDKKLISYLNKEGHTSPFEHCILTVKIVVPLFVRSQHHRHRTWSFSEISRRYTSENIQFYAPKSFRTQHDKDKQASNMDNVNPLVQPYDSLASDLVANHNQNCLDLYNYLLGSGICREQARGVLPQNLYTEYYGSCDLHNLMHFFDLRCDEHAQWEIRKMAEAILEIAGDLWPVAIETYKNSKK